MASRRFWGIDFVLFTIMLANGSLPSFTKVATAAEPLAAHGPFVFAYFDDGESGQSAGLQFAWSRDGADWKKITHSSGVFLKPEVGGKLLRDPSITQGPDGTFHLVWTTAWWKHGIGVAHSTDLFHWSQQEHLDVMRDFPGTINTWAPEIFYDRLTETYLIYWASTIPGKHADTESTGEEIKEFKTRVAHRIYVTTTKDFKTYTPTSLLYDDGYCAIDAFIFADPQRRRYVMIIKDETRFPAPRKNLRVATATNPLGPWSASSAAFSPDWVEGPAVLQVNDEYWLYFDAYTRHRYEGQKTKDFEHWESITDRLSMPQGIRHGTPFPVSEEVLQTLLNSQPSAEKAAP